MASNAKNSRQAEKIRSRREARLEAVVGLVMARRAISGWVDDEQAIAFTACVTPRIRDFLVLRPVAMRNGRGRSGPDAPSAR